VVRTRLRFAGLCLAVKNDEKINSTTGQVTIGALDVVFVGSAQAHGSTHAAAHGHVATMMVDVRNVRVGTTFDWVIDRRDVDPSPTGRYTQYGVWRLDGYELSLSYVGLPADGLTGVSYPVSNSGVPTNPDNPQDWDGLQWIADPAKVSGQSLTAHPSAYASPLTHASVQGIVRLAHGTMAGGRPNSEYRRRRWSTNQPVDQAFTDVVEVRWIDDAKLRALSMASRIPGQSRVVVLEPLDDEIDVVFANLPAIRPGPSQRAVHFDMFYDVLRPTMPPGDPRRTVPQKAPTVDPVFCMIAQINA
jgi:hypothetical protein